MTASTWRWLSQDPNAACKHHEWSHPIAACIIHYIIATVVTFLVHDFVVSILNHEYQVLCPLELTERRHAVAKFLGIYSLWLLRWRLWHAKAPRNHVVYEYMWLCNVTLVLSALGLYYDRPMIATAHCVAVSIDQVLWYVDLLGWTLSKFRKFPIGVAKYITWPETSWVTRITCTHHLWTIPVLLYGTGGGLHLWSYPLSVVVVTVNVILSRWLTPFVLAQRNRQNSSAKYLNVNLSHELWKDIKIELIQINYDNPPTFIYLFRLLCRWHFFNFVVFVPLHAMSYRIFGPPVLSCLEME